MQYFKEEDSIMVCQIKVEGGASKASSSSSSAGTSTCGTKIQLCNDKNLGTRSENVKKHLQKFHLNENRIVKKKFDDETTGFSCKGNILFILFFALNSLAILKQAPRRIFCFLFLS
jgi:hypothetical protein